MYARPEQIPFARLIFLLQGENMQLVPQRQTLDECQQRWDHPVLR